MKINKLDLRKIAVPLGFSGGGESVISERGVTAVTSKEERADVTHQEKLKVRGALRKSSAHIEIVRSSIPALSSMGQKSCDMIVELLGRHYTRVGITTVNNLIDLEALVAKQPDLVFLGMKNVPLATGSDAKVWLSTYLENSGINFTGSGGAAIALDFHKPSAKEVVESAGLATSRYFTASEGQYARKGQLPLDFPLFVKPPATGGGKGIGADSVVRSFAAFTNKVAAIAAEFDCQSLVETYLSGREFSVGVLADGNGSLMAMPIELITEKNHQGDRILGQSIKAADTEHIIAVQDPTTKQLVSDLALDVFKALGAQDYGRIDIRLDTHGTPHFLEANLVPGLANHDFISYFTAACSINLDMDYETMILKIAALGLAQSDIDADFAAEDLFVSPLVTDLPLPALQ